MTIPTQVQRWLQELKETAEAIFKIDFEEEASEHLLLSLQGKQMELRESIRQYIANHQYSYNEMERQIMAECLSLERQISRKIQALHHEASEQLMRIASGRRSRDVYLSEAVQHMGYFIDKHR